jgi:hypothetical protein
MFYRASRERGVTTLFEQAGKQVLCLGEHFCDAKNEPFAAIMAEAMNQHDVKLLRCRLRKHAGSYRYGGWFIEPLKQLQPGQVNRWVWYHDDLDEDVNFSTECGGNAASVYECILAIHSCEDEQ